MPQDDLLRQKIANLQTLWDRLTEKLTGLLQDKILETHGEEKLRLGRLIDETEKERDEVEQKMAYLENRLREVIESDRSGSMARNNQAEYERLQALEDAYWGERARQSEQGGFTGYEETIRRIQERLNAEA